MDVGAAVNSGPWVIAIEGAESTGKTELARGLASALHTVHGLRSTWVNEWLRQWCDREGRTPRPEEQLGIAQEQARRIRHACSEHAVVVADTSALMTAVYSEWLFDDRTLRRFAQEQQQTYALTLVTANDLPWVADGLQRDGPHVREPVRRLVTELLTEAGLPFHDVTGAGHQRLNLALAVVAKHLGLPARAAAATEPRLGRVEGRTQA